MSTECHDNVWIIIANMFERDTVPVLLAMFTGVGQFLYWSPIFEISCIFTSFEFLSTTVHHGSIIQKEFIFIVNNIDKFNVSRFRNTQAHCQRICERSEWSHWRRMQIHDFRTVWWILQLNYRFLCIFVNKNTNKCQHITWITIGYV